MPLCRRVAVLAAAALLVGAAQSSGATPAHTRLVAFGSCGDLVDYVRAQAAPFVSASGLGRPAAVGQKLPPGAVAAPAAAPALQPGVDYSGTNVQEAGVDEPDLVKTDGATLFAAENGLLESVELARGRPRLLDTLPLDGGWSHELLLSGHRLLVLTRGGFWPQALPGVAASLIAPQPSSSTLTEVDVSDPGRLRVVQTLRLDGAYLDARMIGSTVRVISSSSLATGLHLVTPSATSPAALAAAETRNRAVVQSAPARAWLPGYRLGQRSAHPLVQCRHVLRPPAFSGLGMVTVTTIDLAQGLAPVSSTSVLADGRIVYASPSNLYLATEQWAGRPLPAAPTVAPARASTQIHAFSLGDRTTTYLGSGAVSGYLLNQWSLSEYRGVLRVVSTDAPAWWGDARPSETSVTDLRLEGGSLVPVGRLGGLGRGDRVYAVRMLGPTGYVVTFKQVDPLYTLDLHDPAHPAQLGELELPGYSSYLHPLSSTLLLGIGQSLDPQGNEPAGTQVSLFDVASPAHPRLLDRARLGLGWSQAESDHHAFLSWPAANLAVVPFGQQAVALRVGRSAAIAEVGRIVHSQARQASLPLIDRSLVAGGTLFTVSSGGVAANSLANLASLGWAAFPAAPVPKPTPGP